MPAILEVTYHKKCGLPGYSSHGYHVTIREELPDRAAAIAASDELYSQLQTQVDAKLENQIGFVPGDTYGFPTPLYALDDPVPMPSPADVSVSAPRAKARLNAAGWTCSERQTELIINLVAQYDLDKRVIDRLARKMFGAGVKKLTRSQASKLIDEMLRRYRTRSDVTPPPPLGSTKNEKAQSNG